MRPLSVAHFVKDLDRHSGGPSVSVPALCRELCGIGETEVHLFTRPSPDPVPEPESDRFHLHHLDGSRVSVEHALAAAWKGVPAKSRLLHLHGLWDPMNYWASRYARRNHIPVVWSIRGMLEPWALNHKRLKKRLGWHLYQRRSLRHAALLHATSPAEEESLHREALSAVASVVIPNGVAPPPGTDLPSFDFNERSRTLLFLGRLHPVKGIPALLDAWAAGAPEGWTLQLTGPDDSGHRSEIERQIRSLKISHTVLITPAVEGEEKWKLLSSVGCLILPSFSENFGLVVAEALAMGTPVAASTGTPWEILETIGAGWWVQPKKTALLKFLRELGGIDANTRSDMGMKGRQYVLEHHHWSAVAEAFHRCYQGVELP